MSIALKNVNKSFGERTVLNGFSLEFKEGKINCILGPSGCGKTTILNILAGITDCDGQVDKPEKVAYIFQNSRLLPNLTVWENVEYVLLDRPKEERERTITDLLKRVELYDRRNDFPSQLSGGMSRRVAMARAYAYNADLLLMDEPFSALDLGLKMRQLEVYNDLSSAYGKTTVFVTHDVDEALMFADTVTVLKKNGEIADSFEIVQPRGERELFSEQSSQVRKRLYADLMGEPV